MSLLAALLALNQFAAAPLSAMAPPPEQFAANCDAPTYASDRLVCDDAPLRALDARMRQAWAAVDVAAVVAPGAWVEPQADWFRRRSLCAFAEQHVECLQEAHMERITVLELLRAVASRPLRQGAAATCREAPWGEATVRIRVPAPGALAVEDAQARALATATPLRTDAVWTPYVGFTVNGRTIVLQPINGTAITCLLDDPP
jgi:uncharacterized protein